MTSLIRFVLLCLIVGSTYAQSSLPPCRGDVSRWTNCFGAQTFSSGDKFVGEFKDGVRNGQGAFTFANGNKYVGEFKDGVRNGQGTLTFANGNKYVGEYKDDKYNGQGIFTFANGENYVGEFKDGKINGQGTLTLVNGSKFVGEFKDGKRNGQGISYKADGAVVLSGNWSDGKLEKSFAIDTKRYPFNPISQNMALNAPSTVERDRLVAEGVAQSISVSFPSGFNCGRLTNEQNRAACFLSQGQRDPTTAVLSSSVPTPNQQQLGGQTNSGSFPIGFPCESLTNVQTRLICFSSQDRKDALPIVIGDKNLVQSKLPACPSASTYKHNCFGTETFANGDKYVGDWENGKFNGQGTHTFNGGGFYIGTHKDGKRNGHGMFSFPNGGDYVGEWIGGASHGQGTFTHPNGNKFVGEYKNGTRSGHGIEYTPIGSIIRQGRWEGGVLVQSFSLDTQRFPFNPPSQTVAASSLSNSETDRLKVEVEAERRKRQELEQQMASSKERELIAAELDAQRRKIQELQTELDRAKEMSESRVNERPRPQNVQRSERRVALVIGNAQYKSSPLENSVNDAIDIDQALKRFGFQTTFLRNASLSQMRQATRRFADQLTNADVALIYFAGHGIESKNKNYMIPVNADLKFEYELADQAYDAGAWLEMLEMIKSNNAERVNIVILDACRNNNLIGSRSLNRGLARMDAPTGTFLSFSTAPGKVAADGGRGERNSPFTKNLLRAMQQPGQPIEEVFKEVRRNVTRETNGAQVPWESTSLTGFFSFRQTR